MLQQDPTLSVQQPARAPSAVSWGAIFAGTLVSVGVWLLLHVLGIGAGLTSIDPTNADSLRRAGIGTGVWSLLAPLIALFVGGLVVGRLAGPLGRLTGAIHGAVVWSLSTVSAVALVWVAATAVLGGAAAAGSQLVSGAGDMTMSMMNGRNNQNGQGGQTGQNDPLAALGLSADDLLAPINQRLVAAGKPPVRADQLGNAARDALRTSLREGRVDRDILADSLARTTPLSRDDAAALAGTIQGRVDTELQAVERRALQTAEDAGKALLGLFFGMLLGLAAAVAGATLSVSREQKRALQTASRLPPTIVPAH
jgi:hypothetical protein